MKSPKDFTNDELALHLELWVALNDELTESQEKYFEEVIWRLRLTADKEQEKSNNGE